MPVLIVIIMENRERSSVDISTIDVLEFLPQRPPFVLIDKLISYSAQTTQVKTQFYIKEGGTFVDGGFFQPAGIMENIAQSCAARIGYCDWLFARPVKIGVIGAIKSMEVLELPKVGDTIITSITPKSEALGVLLAEAVVENQAGVVVAKCAIKIAVQP